MMNVLNDVTKSICLLFQTPLVHTLNLCSKNFLFRSASGVSDVWGTVFCYLSFKHRQGRFHPYSADIYIVWGLVSSE